MSEQAGDAGDWMQLYYREKELREVYQAELSTLRSEVQRLHTTAAFLLSCVRSGEQLSPDEDKQVRDALNPPVPEPK